jgi:hypothetical protein
MKSREGVVDEGAIAEALQRAEESISRGRGLGKTGFWSAVSKLRRDPVLAEKFAGRAAVIDQKAFEAAVKARVGFATGTGGLGAATIVGVGALMWAGRLEPTLRTFVFLGGFGTLLISTHSLTHVLVGRLLGIRFTHFFLGGPPPPRPGAKVDYESYLKVSPKKRAAMHASGAIVTKILPFALIPWASAVGVRQWAIYLLVAVGVIQIITDSFLSTKTSDWKKVLRELKAARVS